MPSSEFHYFSLKNLSLRSFSECFLRCLAGALFLQMMAPHIRTDAECQNQDHKDRGGGVRQCLILTVYLKVQIWIDNVSAGRNGLNGQVGAARFQLPQRRSLPDPVV